MSSPAFSPILFRSSGSVSGGKRRKRSRSGSDRYVFLEYEPVNLASASMPWLAT